MTDRPDPSEVSDPVIPEDQQWERLHPGTILDDALQRLPNVAVGLFLILTSGGGDAAVELIQLGIGFLALFPVVVRYLTGRYRLGPEVLQWRMGIVTKVHTDLPRYRIQSVDTRISVVGRMLGLESVVISSAGGEGEIRIGLVTAAAAERLRTELQPSTTPDVGASPEVDPLGPVVADVPVTELARMSASDLPRVIGVEVGRIAGLVLLALLAIVVGAGIVSGRLGFGSLFVVLPSVFGAFGLARGMVTEAIGFSSELRADRIRVARGVFARSTFEARLARIQGVTVKRTVVARRIGTERISVDTADVSDEGSNAPGRTQTLIHPTAVTGTWRGWTSIFLRGATPDPDRFRPVAPVSLRRRWLAVLRFAVVWWVILLVAVLIARTWIDAEDLLRGAAAALGLVVPLWLGTAETLRYRNERWALGDDQVAFVGGALATTLVAIPRVRTQGTVISANWFQRRLGIADLTVDTASPTVGGTGRDLHLEDASSVASAVLASADAEGGV